MTTSAPENRDAHISRRSRDLASARHPKTPVCAHPGVFTQAPLEAGRAQALGRLGNLSRMVALPGSSTRGSLIPIRWQPHPRTCSGRNMTTLRASCCVMLVLGGACRPSDEIPAALRVTIDSSGTYPVVRSLGVAPRWNAEQVLVLGAPAGPTEFGSVRSVLLDQAGSLYVVDPSRRTLSIFDSTGRFVRQLGRDGAGPGEYRDPYSVAWVDGQLALLDPGNFRLGLYDSTGRWKNSWPVSRITGDQGIRLYRTPPTFWTYGFRSAGAQLEGIFIRYTTAGPGDTLPFIRPASASASGRLCESPGKGIRFFAAPFGAALLQIPTPSGTRALALSTAYRIAFLDSAGDTVRVIEREIPPTSVSNAEWEEANAGWLKFRRDWPTATCDGGDFSRPAAKPPLAWLFYDDRGRLWVETVTPDGPRYDVFAESGALLGSVTGLPATGGVDPSVARQRVAIAGKDSADIPIIRVFRLSP